MYLPIYIDRTYEQRWDFKETMKYMKTAGNIQKVTSETSGNYNETGFKAISH